jgi:amidophosphoribosyltransferase
MRGTTAIGCISDSDPQPLLIRSHLGTFAICIVGTVNNQDELVKVCLSPAGHFNAMTGGEINSTELVAALINQQEDFVSGIRYAQSVVDGTANILIMKEDGSLITARDRVGRLPVLIGKNEDGYCVTFESFAYKKLGYEDEKELGPGEIVELTADGIRQLSPPGEEMKICASFGPIGAIPPPLTRA